jgi:hypothetical protein
MTSFIKTTDRKVFQVEVQIETLRKILIKNMDTILQRCENVEIIQQRTNELREHAKFFQIKSKELKEIQENQIAEEIRETIQQAVVENIVQPIKKIYKKRKLKKNKKIDKVALLSEEFEEKQEKPEIQEVPTVEYSLIQEIPQETKIDELDDEYIIVNVSMITEVPPKNKLSFAQRIFRLFRCWCCKI